LQFEVVQYRLQSEYGAESRLESAEWSQLRWIAPEVPEAVIEAAILPSGTRLATDSAGQSAVLFPSEWSVRYFAQQNPAVLLSDTPVRQGSIVKQ
jgi:peptide chain release factor 3